MAERVQSNAAAPDHHIYTYAHITKICIFRNNYVYIHIHTHVAERVQSNAAAPDHHITYTYTHITKSRHIQK